MMTFDQALPSLAKLAYQFLGSDTVGKGLVLRDAQGALTFIIRNNVHRDDRFRFDEAAKYCLQPYANEPSATPDELFDLSLFLDDDSTIVLIDIDEGISIQLRLLDRQIIGQDWTRPNFTPAADVPLLTFFSCKGGVGRSTALAITAADLSAQGKSVLIIDFDLEAPGIGSILLKNDDLPQFGLLDYLVESHIQPISDDFLESCIAPSPLTGGRGLIEIMPALGINGKLNPSDVLPKLGRAYLDQPREDDSTLSYLDQMRFLVDRLARRGKSDAIFIDARAGLSESTAPAIVGLGGDILMFGVDTPQTIECYSYLLSHLSRFAPTVEDPNDWRSRLRMVHAKSGRGEDNWKKYRETTYDLFARFLYEETVEQNSELISFNFDIDDPIAPHFPWPIPFDVDFSEFDPTKRQSVLQRDFYDRTFGNFTSHVTDLLFPKERLADG